MKPNFDIERSIYLNGLRKWVVRSALGYSTIKPTHFWPRLLLCPSGLVGKALASKLNGWRFKPRPDQGCFFFKSCFNMHAWLLLVCFLNIMHACMCVCVCMCIVLDVLSMTCWNTCMLKEDLKKRNSILEVLQYLECVSIKGSFETVLNMY